jgi:uncharacterized BrkB/YihY/UPF0761 family membrane protein
MANIVLYTASFRMLTPLERGVRRYVAGATVAGAGFTALMTVGSGLVQHQLRHSSSTYGAFAAVIGVVLFLLLLAKLTVYAAELNPVLERRLWPRALVSSNPTEADERVLRAETQETQRRADEVIEVGFADGSDSRNADTQHHREPQRRGASDRTDRVRTASGADRSD